MEHIETEVSKFENEEETDDDKKKKVKKFPKKEKKKKNGGGTVYSALGGDKKYDELEPIYHLPGLKNIKLHVLTQKILRCQVGEHVTAESPWTTIDKDVVDENLYLHHDSSDFLPVKDDLLEYTGSKILVGYDANYMPQEDEESHRFYIAVNESTKNKILSTLNEERRLAEQRLKNAIHKKVLPWMSLGSESEVDESIVKDSRPRIQLELETDIDELLKPTNFKDRNVKDAKDGYLRIGPGRFEFEGVQKLRVNAGVQAVPILLPNTAQTDPGLPSNAWTQYDFEIIAAQGSLEQNESKELKRNHVFAEQDYLERALEYNENLDLYTNDYPLLVCKTAEDEKPQASLFEEYEAYTDVSHCRNKLISSIAWHPMWSGIVALSYSFASRSVTASETLLTGDEVLRDTFSKNFVLLWSFKDALKPRLILESPREVHCLAWCPTDANILAGGCSSGQIILWDLKGKLDAVEIHEHLSPEQQKHRMMLQNLIGWSRPQPPSKYVRPAALSNLQYSHSGRVTQVQWISPYFEWTIDGQYSKVEKGRTSMQIMSCAEDGQLMVWDLNKVPEDVGGPRRPRRKKTRKRHSALLSQISHFRIFDRKMVPMYILYPDLPASKIATKLTNFSLVTNSIKYEVDKEALLKEIQKIMDSPKLRKYKYNVNTGAEISDRKDFELLLLLAEETEEETNGTEEHRDGTIESLSAIRREYINRHKELESGKNSEISIEQIEEIYKDDITFRKMYKPILDPPEEPPTQLFQVGTDEGESIILRWEGFDFSKGEEITTEKGILLNWGAGVHDGPIVACARSPFIEDLFLTVGGKVVAIWNSELKNQPIFWKYSPVGLTCCAWSPFRPCLFQVGRRDGSLEVWDLSKYSNVPIVVQSISGKPLTSMAEHSLPLCSDKAVLGVSDFNNSFRLLFFPEEYKNPEPKELETLKKFVEREVYVRKFYVEWNNNFTKSNADDLAKRKSKEEAAEKKRLEAEWAAQEDQRARVEEEEEKRLARSRRSSNDKFLEKLKKERERQMQRVLMEKKRLNKSELLAKQQPILLMKQMEKEKRKKQKEKIKQQEKIFNKTVAMLFPEVVEKPEGGPSRMDEFEAELMEYQPILLAQYDKLLPIHLKHIKDNPFNKRMRWEKVFEEGMLRRNVLDFPLYLRRMRKDRYLNSKVGGNLYCLYDMKKGKVGFKCEKDEAEKKEKKEKKERKDRVLEGEEVEEEIDEEEEEEEEAERDGDNEVLDEDDEDEIGDLFTTEEEIQKQ